MEYDKENALHVLNLMENGYYNNDRKIHYVIEDLIDVIIYQNKRISELQEKNNG